MIGGRTGTPGLAVDRAGHADHHRPHRDASAPGTVPAQRRAAATRTAASTVVRAVGDVDVDVLVRPRIVWLRSTTARCAPRAPRSASSTCPPRGESASRSAGRPRPAVGRVPSTRSTPRASSSSTAVLTVVRASPAAGHEVGLAHRGAGGDQPGHRAQRDGGVEPAGQRRARSAAAAAAARVQHHGPISSEMTRKRHYSVVVRHWSMLLGFLARRRTTRWRHD